MSQKAVRAIMIILVLGLMLSGAGRISLFHNDPGPGSAPPTTAYPDFYNTLGFHVLTASALGIYAVQEISRTENRFVNYVDGYGISIPKEMKVLDMSAPGVRAVLEDEHRRIEIYKETLDKGVSANDYIHYSNKSLFGRADHQQVYAHTFTWNGMQVNVVEWCRDKLAKIDNDKNYYACVDIMGEDAVYTFFFKADLPLEECGGYMDIIQSFYTFAPQKNTGLTQLKHIEKKKWNAETQAMFQKYFSADSSLSWGIFEPSAPMSMEELQALEQKLDYEFPFVLLYTHVKDEYDPYVGRALRNAYQHGKIVELTLQTKAAGDGQSNRIYDLLDGKYDAFLQAYAQDVAAFGHPVLFRPFNEMNGDWCPYSAYHTSRDTEIFKSLYKYLYSIFEAAGADNVIWVWNPNEKSFPDFKWNHEIMYYPGDKYVDVIGLTGYNTGTYYSGEKWRSFQEIYDPLYQKALALYDKPMMITEFSSSSVGGSKEQWVADMFNGMDRYPRIKVAIWWDGCDFDAQGNRARPYFIDETDGLLQVFRDHLHSYE
jgi:beta-mannanase